MEETVQKLEQRINDIVKLTEKMRRDYEYLQNDHSALRQEFNSLQEKNKIALGRIEQIIARLNALQD